MKKFLKAKVIAIILVTTLLSNNNAYGWEFGTKVINGINSFFTADTNPLLKPTPGVIQGAKETLSYLDSKVGILQSTYNQIPRNIELISKASENIIDPTNNTQTLENVQKCIAEYQNSTNNVINFINANAKKIFTPIKRWFGLRRGIEEHNEYPLHNSISKNGLTYGAPEYLVDVTESQRLNLANFEKCVANVPGNQNVININWFKKLIADKNVINKEANLAMWENRKYHIRKLLESITPNDPRLKWALIIGVPIVTIATIYGLTKIYQKFKNYRNRIRQAQLGGERNGQVVVNVQAGGGQN